MSSTTPRGLGCANSHRDGGYWRAPTDAVEGEDYSLERLLPFWQLTSEQDWDLCEKNQAGVRSSAFTPGPYSTKLEYNVIRYVDWYLSRIAKL